MGEFHQKFRKIAIAVKPFAFELGERLEADYEQLYANLDKIVEEAKKEFPVIGWLAGIEHDLSAEECTQVYDWFKRWFM